MVAEEKIAISYEVKNSGQFLKSAKDVEKALRAESKALDANALEIRKRIVELKKSDNPDKQLIKNLQLQAQQAKLSAQSVRNNAAAVKESTTANKGLLSTIAGRAGLVGGYVALGAAVVGATTAIVKSADEYNSLQARIRSATDATGDYIGVSRELNKISQTTGTTLESNVELFQRLRFAADSLGASNQDILKFGDAIAKIGVISGSSTQAIQAGTLQLGQALTMVKPQAEEINSLLENMPGVAKRIEQGLGLLPGQLKNAIKEGKVLSKEIFQVLLNQSGDINKEFEKFPKNLGRSAETAKNSFDQFSSALDNALGITNLLADSLQGIANIFNGLTSEILKNTTQIKLFKNEIGRFIEFAGVVDPFNPSTFGKDIDKLKEDVEKKYNQNLIQIGLDTAFDAAQKTGVSDKKSAGFNVVDQEALKKLEKKRLQDIQERLALQLRAIDVNSDKGISMLGPNARQEDINLFNTQRVANKGKVSQAALKALIGTRFSTDEGIAEANKFKNNLKLDIQDLKNDYKSLNNEVQKFQQEQERFAKQSERDKEVTLFGAAVENVKTGLAEVQEDTERAYAQNRVTIQEYYATERDLIQQNANLQQAELELRKNQLEDQKSLLTQSTEDQRERLRLDNQILQVNEEIKTLKGRTAVEIRRSNKDEQDALSQTARSFSQELGNAISSAITEAFDGSGPLKAAVNFAKKLKDLLIGSIGQAIADGLGKSQLFQGVSKAVGSFIDKIAGRSGGAGSLASNSLTGGIGTPASPGLNITKAGLLKGGIGALLLGGGQLVSTRGGKGALAGIGGAGLGVLGGAIAGSVLGPVGTIGGAVLGGISSAASNSRSGGFFSTGAGKALAFASPAFGLYNLLSSGKRKKEEERARQQAIADELVNRAMTGADQNNVLDLQARKDALVNNNKGLTGSRVKTIRDAANQLQALIDARKKSIDEALKEFAKQNKDLADQVALNDAKPFEKAALERQIAIRQIQFDTQKLLDQFKDSEKAKTAILEQEALKRKLLQQEENEAAKQTVEDLADLLKQRDEVANSNVFQRAKSAEQIKKEALQNLDKDIASAYLTLQGQLAAGATPGNTASLNQILAQAGQLSGQQNTLNIVINEANNPAMVQEALSRAFAAFTQKIYGANVA